MHQKPEHIDKAFQQRLQDIAPPPPAFVWDEIERALKKRRRRRLLFWMLTGGFAGMSALGFWALSPRQTDILPQDAPEAHIIAAPAGNTHDAVSTTSEKPEIATADKIAVDNTTVAVLPAKTAGRPANPVSVESFLPTNNHIPAAGATLSSNAPDSEPRMTLSGVVDKGAVPGTLSALPLPDALFVRPPDAAAVKPRLITAGSTATRRTKKTVRNCYDFSRHPLVWMAEAYGGPSLAQRELVSSPDDQPYLNERLKTERPDVAFNAGVRAAVVLQGNFLIRSGLQYDQFTEIFEYVDPDYIKYIVEIVNHGGQQTIDTVGVEYGEEYLKTYNRYGFLDVPLQVGVEFRKGRSGFNFNAGMALNLLFWKRGAIISPDTREPVYFTPGRAGAADIFRTNAGLSASASVQWFYHLRPRLRVFAEPYFKRVLKPVTLPGHPVEQRYGIMGLRLGVSTILN